MELICNKNTYQENARAAAAIDAMLSCIIMICGASEEAFTVVDATTVLGGKIDHTVTIHTELPPDVIVKFLDGYYYNSKVVDEFVHGVIMPQATELEIWGNTYISDEKYYEIVREQGSVLLKEYVALGCIVKNLKDFAPLNLKVMHVAFRANS